MSAARLCTGFLTPQSKEITFAHVPASHVVVGCSLPRERKSVYCALHRGALTARKTAGRPRSFTFEGHHVIGAPQFERRHLTGGAK